MYPQTKSAAFARLSALNIVTVIDVGVQAQTESLIAAYPHSLHLLIESDPQWISNYPTAYAGIQHITYLMHADTIRRIDGLSFDGPALLKIDVDGGEIDVLRGATNTLDRIAVIAVEATSDSICNLVEFATAHNFRLFDIVDLCRCGNQLHQCDLIFVAAQFAPLVFTPWDIRLFQPLV